MRLLLSFTLLTWALSSAGASTPCPPPYPSGAGGSKDKCFPFCVNQGDPRTACWKCLGFDESEGTFTIDFTDCGYTDVCCQGGCTDVTDALPSSRRRLNQLSSLVRTYYQRNSRSTMQGSSKYQANRPRFRRRALQSTESCFSNTFWRFCPAKSASCCAVGPDSPCAQQHVCEFTLDFTHPMVCPPVGSLKKSPPPPPLGKASSPPPPKRSPSPPPPKKSPSPPPPKKSPPPPPKKSPSPPPKRSPSPPPKRSPSPPPKQYPPPPRKCHSPPRKCHSPPPPVKQPTCKSFPQGQAVGESCSKCPCQANACCDEKTRICWGFIEDKNCPYNKLSCASTGCSKAKDFCMCKPKSNQRPHCKKPCSNKKG